ncbi:MAG: ribonuclease III [Clostridia bacterium]|nr:ribonuclease III [Clostridia bacterium]
MEKSLDIKQYSPLALAFLGDAVYELYVRSKILAKTNAPADVLHKMAVKYVKASAQCEAFDRIESLLTDEEMTVFKRGRNAKTNTKAKNAGLAEYKKATGFEALLGYLHVKGEDDRLNELLTACGEFE